MKQNMNKIRKEITICSRQLETENMPDLEKSLSHFSKQRTYEFASSRACVFLANSTS